LSNCRWRKRKISRWLLAGFGLGISTVTKKKELAWEFIKMGTSVAMRQAIWCKDNPQRNIYGVPEALYTDHISKVRRRIALD
jgi:hypothetical protein